MPSSSPSSRSSSRTHESRATVVEPSSGPPRLTGIWLDLDLAHRFHVPSRREPHEEEATRSLLTDRHRVHRVRHPPHGPVCHGSGPSPRTPGPEDATREAVGILMALPSTVYTAGDFIRRVVDSLLHGECRGQFLC